MTGAMLFVTVIEIAVVILLILGFVNEKKVIEFEDRLAFALAKAIRTYLRQRKIKKRAKAQQHLKIVPSTQKDKRISHIA